eukprot:TRINITY_DN4454_c0_g1_i1.p2 TRINITY_DN4454_c0_g1~~TRINITY_DN4454_c0_g1_i1.p2  ORF type:complete len:185 (-),score=33.72 TRINITY_DN4454_c0_g1_i1:860-1414(-)
MSQIFNLCFLYCVDVHIYYMLFFFFLMIRRPPRSTQGVSSAASDVYKRQGINAEYMGPPGISLPAGGKHPERRLPPTTAASPEYSRPTTQPPPASICSLELSYPPQSFLPRSPLLIGTPSRRPSKKQPFIEHTEKTDGIYPIGLKNIVIERLSDQFLFCFLIHIYKIYFDAFAQSLRNVFEHGE